MVCLRHLKGVQQFLHDNGKRGSAWYNASFSQGSHLVCSLYIHTREASAQKYRAQCRSIFVRMDHSTLQAAWVPRDRLWEFAASLSQSLKEMTSEESARQCVKEALELWGSSNRPKHLDLGLDGSSMGLTNLPIAPKGHANWQPWRLLNLDHSSAGLGLPVLESYDDKGQERIQGRFNPTGSLVFTTMPDTHQDDATVAKRSSDTFRKQTLAVSFRSQEAIHSQFDVFLDYSRSALGISEASSRPAQ